LGVDPARLTLGGAVLERVDERAGRAGQVAQRGVDRVERLLVEPGADATGVAERTVGVVIAEEQRAERRRARTFAREPAAHGELLLVLQLVLEPGGRAPARLVPAVDALGDDALERELLADGDGRVARPDRVRRDAPRRAVLDELAQQPPPRLVGEAGGVL